MDHEWKVVNEMGPVLPITVALEIGERPGEFLICFASFAMKCDHSIRKHKRVL